jgi:benzoate membrane transport protein
MGISALDTTQQGWVRAFGTAVPMIILPIVILSFPVTAASQMGLSSGQLSSWIAALYGVPGLIGLALSWRYQQPLMLTGNVFILVFIVSLEGRYLFSDFVGAAMLAGIAVVIVSILGLTDWLSRLIPPPVVLGLLAGAVLPIVADLFTFLGDEPVIVGSAFLAFLSSQRFPGSKIPPVLPAIVAGTAAAAITGSLGNLPGRFAPPSLEIVMPTLTLESVVAIAPIMVILLTLQSTVPSLVFLGTQGYDPPERQIFIIGGISTAIGSLAGPTGVSLSLPATSLIAGPHAGDARYRHRAGYIASASTVIVVLFSGIVGTLLNILPIALLLSIAGLASIGILTHALHEVTSGPLTLGPLFAFATALSDISLLGLGPYFWALAIGTGVSVMLEREGLQRLHSPEDTSR